jgi:hypothetical protein
MLQEKEGKMLSLLSRHKCFVVFVFIIGLVTFVFLNQPLPLKGAIKAQSFSEIKAVNPFPPEMGGIKKGMEVSGEYLFYCDIKMPAGMTGDIIGRLISLDLCGKEIAQPQDIVISATGTTPQRVYKFAPVFQDITLVLASEQPDPQRYTLYRTEKSIMALDCILEEGKVPSDYNIIVHHIDPIGKVRFELVTSVPPGEPSKINRQAPAMVKDIAGIRVDGSLPSFSIVLATRPRFTVVFPDNIQPGTLEVVRDDGDNATADEVEIPTNLFVIHGNKAETPVVRPELEVPAGVYRIVATATSEEGTPMRLESNVLIYRSAQPVIKSTFDARDTIIKQSISVANEDIWNNRLEIFVDPKLIDQSISAVLRRHTLVPRGMNRFESIISVKAVNPNESMRNLQDRVFEDTKVSKCFFVRPVVLERDIMMVYYYERVIFTAELFTPNVSTQTVNFLLDDGTIFATAVTDNSGICEVAVTGLSPGAYLITAKDNLTGYTSNSVPLAILQDWVSPAAAASNTNIQENNDPETITQIKNILSKSAKGNSLLTTAKNKYRIEIYDEITGGAPGTMGHTSFDLEKRQFVIELKRVIRQGNADCVSMAITLGHELKHLEEDLSTINTLKSIITFERANNQGTKWDEISSTIDKELIEGVTALVFFRLYVEPTPDDARVTMANFLYGTEIGPWSATAVIKRELKNQGWETPDYDNLLNMTPEQFESYVRAICATMSVYVVTDEQRTRWGGLKVKAVDVFNAIYQEHFNLNLMTRIEEIITKWGTPILQKGDPLIKEVLQQLADDKEKKRRGGK